MSPVATKGAVVAEQREVIGVAPTGVSHMNGAKKAVVAPTRHPSLGSIVEVTLAVRVIPVARVATMVSQAVLHPETSIAVTFIVLPTAYVEQIIADVSQSQLRAESNVVVVHAITAKFASTIIDVLRFIMSLVSGGAFAAVSPRIVPPVLFARA
jgi:hypothetical protein